MGKFHADTMSGESVPSVHAGLNTVVSNITLTETASGSVTIALAVLPGGARVTDLIYQSGTVDGTGGESVFISCQGNQYLSTVADAQFLRASASASGLGERLTSDATLSLQLCNVVGTGTSAQVIRVITSYLADKDPD